MQSGLRPNGQVVSNRLLKNDWPAFFNGALQQAWLSLADKIMNLSVPDFGCALRGALPLLTGSRVGGTLSFISAARCRSLNLCSAFCLRMQFFQSIKNARRNDFSGTLVVSGTQCFISDLVESAGFRHVLGRAIDHVHDHRVPEG